MFDCSLVLLLSVCFFAHRMSIDYSFTLLLMHQPVSVSVMHDFYAASFAAARRLHPSELVLQ